MRSEFLLLFDKDQGKRHPRGNGDPSLPSAIRGMDSLWSLPPRKPREGMTAERGE
jgi:hypothetical protein